MHIELKDLPPKMQRQALKIIAEEDARRGTVLKSAAKISAGKNVGREDFDSRGEYEYYMGVVRQKLKTGEIVRCERQPVFELFPKGEYGGEKLRAIRYTADFKNEYADGTVEIVEVKSRFVRRMQRDYPVRRRIFIEQYARPNGWKFTEVMTDGDAERGKEEK